MPVLIPRTRSLLRGYLFGFYRISVIDLQALKEKVDFYTIKKLHHLGITADIAAVTVGGP